MVGASPDNRSIVDLQRRAVWVSVALILQTLNEIDQAVHAIDATWLFIFRILIDSMLPLTLTAGSFVALALAIRPLSLRQQARYAQRPPALWQRTVLCVMLLVVIGGSVVIGFTIVRSFLPPSFANDGTSLDTNAAILLSQGHNPYTNSSILEVYRRFGIQPTWTTPLRQGQFHGQLDYPSQAALQAAFQHGLQQGQAPEFESRVSYPALSFVSLLPFVLFKDYNVLPFYGLCYLLLVLLAWRAARPELRSWVVFLGLANVPMLASTLNGNLDIFYILLITLAWLWRDQRWRSALLLGLAIACKQIAWLFLPFYFVLTWRSSGFREACNRLLISGCLGLAINLPFILWDPHAWLLGVLAPVMDPMFPMGVGVISLSVVHLLPYLPNWFYLLLEVGVFVGALIGYWRICLRRPEAALLLAILPLFFAWRSLPSYFYCAAYPLFVLLVARRRRAVSAQSEREPIPLRNHPAFLPQLIGMVLLNWRGL